MSAWLRAWRCYDVHVRHFTHVSALLPDRTTVTILQRCHLHRPCELMHKTHCVTETRHDNLRYIFQAPQLYSARRQTWAQHNVAFRPIMKETGQQQLIPVSNFDRFCSQNLLTMSKLFQPLGDFAPGPHWETCVS